MTNLAIEQGICEATLVALRTEFGAVIAARILEAEVADFLWEARTRERYLGQHREFGEDEESELSRVAILSFLDGAWRAGVCLADGDGAAVALLWQRRFARRDEAQAAFERAA